MKKNSILFLVICFLFSITVEAKKKSFGDNLFWEITSTGELVISGIGAMPNYKSGKAPWTKYHNKIHTITIEEGITHVGDCSFGKDWLFSKKDIWKNIKNIYLPMTLKSIGKSSFAYSSIKKILLPESLNIIDDCAFESCCDLEEIIIPNSVTSIGKSSFHACLKLKEVQLSENLTIIPEAAFYQCFSLKHIKLPMSIKRIEEYAFWGCSLTGISIPHYVEYIGKSAFSGDKSLQLIIPNGVKGIEERAFGSGYLEKDLFHGLIGWLPVDFVNRNTKNNDVYGLNKFGISTKSTRNYLNSVRDDNGMVTIYAIEGRKIEKIKDVYKYINFNEISIVDKKGNDIIPWSRKYEEIDRYDNYYLIKRNGKRGVCNLEGKEIIEPQYDAITELSNDDIVYYKVCKSGLYGLLNSEGNIILPAEIQQIESIGAGFFKFEINGFWGVIDGKGNTIIPTSRGYTSIGNYISSMQRFPYTMNGYKGECDKTGSQISKTSISSSNATQKNTRSSTSTSYSDALVFDLKGRVKSCKITENHTPWNINNINKDYTINFSSLGKLTPKDSSLKIERDDKGRLKKVDDYRITYNDKGQVKNISYMSSIIIVSILYDSNYIYDNKGRIITNRISNLEMYGFDSLGATSNDDHIYNYTYTKFDSKGNWIERKVTDNKGEVEGGVERRTITYY